MKILPGINILLNYKKDPSNRELLTIKIEYLIGNNYTKKLISYLFIVMEVNMKTIAYLRVSTTKQDLDNQRLAIWDYTYKNNMQIHSFIEIQISARKTTKERKIDQLLKELEENDTLIVTELSRLGRSLGQIIRFIDELNRKNIKLISIKENIILNNKGDLQTKVMIAMFSIFAEIEHDLISQRTFQGMATAKAKGKRIGRPRGSLGRSKIDGYEEDIKEFLLKKVSKASIARIVGVSYTALCSFIKSRKLV